MNASADEILWQELGQASKTVEYGIDSLERKRTGSYYTDLKLTDIMMSELVEKVIGDGREIWNCRFLEPCVGSGNFVFSYLKAVCELNLSKDKILSLLNNIYVADINVTALDIYKTSLRRLTSFYWDIELSDIYFEEHTGKGLLIDVTASELIYTRIEDIWGRDISNGFDIIATNPPYKNLKAERTQYSSDKEYENDKEKYSSISQIVTEHFKYSTEGVLNLYKLFVEEIVDKYANSTAYISLLIPSSILSDKTCAKLRTHILVDMKLISVKMIREGSGFINAQQALSAILLKKGTKTSNVNIVKDFCEKPSQSANVYISDILNDDTGNAIFAVSDNEYRTLKALKRFPTIKNLAFIKNLRGELDLTSDKRHITNAETAYRLLRGRNIGYYSVTELENIEYVSENFVLTSKKSPYSKGIRIACQQVANMHKERRITFTFVDPNTVLGNSCNFITVTDNEYGIDLYSILGILNTKIINWFFKLTSSNNHINNYEIDTFPIPVNAPEMKNISTLVQKYLETGDASIIDEIEHLAETAYGLQAFDDGEDEMKSKHLSNYISDIQMILPSLTAENAKKLLRQEISISDLYKLEDRFVRNVAEGITDKYISLYNGRVLNHQTFKLSDLDLEMIASVPQGGSWKDIPEATVNKSKRLMRINSTGGRTTLYGRIDYNKPSYTITTYFNRPGNGTYVHPVLERVISVREAARFQSFRDDYYFFGNKTQLLKQVGNAVPTLLAYQIGKCIVDKTGCNKSIDLFCGAGGLTCGFKAAGIKSLLSTDIEESACTTLKINNPEITVLCGDIKNEETKNSIEAVAKHENVDIICGGPPCQGFSLAGFRSETDPRNQLFKDFVDVVKRVNPKIIVFENVEGFLSYQGGKTYREVHTLFSELGYITEGRTLNASDYGVPQRRKRVIIICTRKDLKIAPDELFPTPTTISETNKITAKNAIYDLEKVECSDMAKYDTSMTLASDILQFFRGKLSYDEYIHTLPKPTANNTEYIQLSLFDI